RRPAGASQCGGPGADHADVQPLLLYDRGRHAVELTIAEQQIVGHAAARTLRCHGALSQHEYGKSCRCQESHASPPARSAFADFGRVVGPRPSKSLYHIIRAAVPIIITIPNALITISIQIAPDTSTIAKWPAKARKMPKQKISRECCPHRMAG